MLHDGAAERHFVELPGEPAQLGNGRRRDIGDHPVGDAGLEDHADIADLPRALVVKFVDLVAAVGIVLHQPALR
ncbi:hypothetical protein D9M72_555560 [compost metagenome]